MASTIKKGCHIAPNVPLGGHILAAGLDIAAESTMAKFAERDTLCLALFASYKYIQFLHLSTHISILSIGVCHMHEVIFWHPHNNNRTLGSNLLCRGLEYD